MPAGRWQQIEQLYHTAVEQAPEDRAAFLAQVDPELRREVEHLLTQAETQTLLEASAKSGASGPLAETATFPCQPKQLGPYEVVSWLGRGGMGEVFRARDPKLERDVAIKVLPPEVANDPDRLTRFRREARTLAALNHPGIGGIYGLEESDGLSFLVLELVEGETVAEHLARAGAPPLPASLEIAAQIADALEAAHAKGIIHRDIKPANIKITPEGRVKVLDFGLAKHAVRTPQGMAPSQVETLTAATSAGQILGTPAYMSPEQARGRWVDSRTDVWAFGCVLFELLSGTRAFRGQTLPDLMTAILSRPPYWDALPAATPERIRALLQRCLEKDLSQRLASIAEARKEIALVQAGRSGVSRRTVIAASAAGVAAAVGLPVAFNLRGIRGRLTNAFAGPRIRSIAVLPLANLSGDPQQEYLSDGMTESFINGLAQIGALKVISRTSAMAYKGTTKPLRQIAQELGVDAVLEGAAVRSGNRVRISTQLINAQTDRQLWAESYDRDFADLLTLEGEVARTVAQQVGAQLTAQEQTRLTAARRVDPEAHDAYLQGLFYFHRAGEEGFDEAQRYLELAIMHDPDYALAYATLAHVWTSRQQANLVPPQRAGALAVAAADRAAALDPGLAEAHDALATVKGFTLWDWQGAEDEFVQAIALNPNFARARAGYSHLLIVLGRNEEARVQVERALELDPQDYQIWGFYGVVLYYLGRYEEAIKAIEHEKALNPSFGWGWELLWVAPHLLGRDNEAVEALAAEERPDGAAALRRGYRQGGFQAAMLTLAQLWETRQQHGESVDPGDLVGLFMGGGRPDLALPWYEKMVEAHDPNAPYLRFDPICHWPEDDPRFQVLVKRMGLP